MRLARRRRLLASLISSLVGHALLGFWPLSSLAGDSASAVAPSLSLASRVSTAVLQISHPRISHSHRVVGAYVPRRRPPLASAVARGGVAGIWRLSILQVGNFLQHLANLRVDLNDPGAVNLLTAPIRQWRYESLAHRLWLRIVGVLIPRR